MKQETQAAFDAVFAAHTVRLESARQAHAIQESKEEAFERAFKQARVSLMKPALEQIGQYLTSKGMETRISESDGHTRRDGRRESDTAISIHLVVGDTRLGSPPDAPPRHYSDYEQPYLRLVCDKHKQQVIFLENTVSPGRGGQSGSSGSVDLDKLTGDLIEQKVLSVVGAVLK